MPIPFDKHEHLSSGNIAEIKTSGDIITTGGKIEASKDTNTTHTLGYAAIGYTGFNNQAGFGHTAVLGDNDGFALLQSNVGSTFLHAKAGKTISFRIGQSGINSMTCHANGSVQVGPATAATAGVMLDVNGNLQVDGNIKATGNLHKLESTQEQYGVVITKDNHNLTGIAGSKGAGLIIHGDATSSNAYGGSLAITGAQVNQGGHGPFVEFLGSRSTYAQLASGTHTAVADGDVLGYFRWMGDDGTDVRNFAADISCEVDGTVAENKVPGAIRFRTHNGTSFGERMRLSATGNLGIGTTSPLEKMHVNGDMLLMSPSQGTDASLFFGTPFTNSNSIKTAIIAEGQEDWSKSKLHFCVANASGSNDPVDNASLSDARMTIQPNGNVGIGTTNPGQKLDVAGSMKSLGVIYSSTATTKEWKTSVDSNGNLYFRFNNGNGAFSERGYFNQNANVNDIDFTGQHRSKFEGEFTSEFVGLIVESTGAYLELDGSVKPKIDEALPSVKLTTAAKSKRVYGVLSNIEGDTREYGSGFVTVVPKDDNITRVVVNSVGEGSLWVINTRDQSLENGDYICSSSVAGYGEKQDDDILHSYTVAKITMSLDWSNIPDWLETRKVTASGEVSETGAYKAAFLGVTYHCG